MTNGDRFANFCELDNVLVIGTICPSKLICKQTWTSLGGTTKNTIDNMLVSRRGPL